MFGVLKYSHLSAKLGAMRGNMLTNDDYEQMMRKISVSEIAAYLKDNTYYRDVFLQIQNPDIHRGFLEMTLYRAQMMDALKIARYLKGSDKLVYRYVYRKMEIEDLKRMMRTLQQGHSLETINYDTFFISKYSKIDFDEALRSKNLGELISSLKGTNFYRILSPLLISDMEIDLYGAEMALDMYYYSKLSDHIKKSAKGKTKEMEFKLFGVDADLKNILWIYRVKRFYRLPKEMIYGYLVPMSHRLKTSQVMKMIEAKDEAEVVAVIAETFYGNILGSKPEEWELKALNYVAHVHRTTKTQNPYSMAPIIGYMLMKDIEIGNIIKIVEGVRYKVSTEIISSMLADSRT